MNFIKKNKKEISAVVLFFLGVVTILLGKNNFVQGGLTCACWAGACFMMALATRDRGVRQMENFELGAKEILSDLETNGENSEYYGVVNFNTINKQRLKLNKNIRKQVLSCNILGIILLISCILCVI